MKESFLLKLFLLQIFGAKLTTRCFSCVHLKDPLESNIQEDIFWLASAASAAEKKIKDLLIGSSVTSCKLVGSWHGW